MKKAAFILILSIIPLSIVGQAKNTFYKSLFYKSLEVVQAKIEASAEAIEIVNIKTPNFPLASKTETHLICTNLKTKNGIIKKVVFTFADNKLNYIEARGNAIETLINKRKDTARSYLDYKVFFSELIFGDTKNDIVWILTKEAAHPHLFTWKNPYLTSISARPQYKQSVKIPDFIELGGSFKKLSQIFKSKCTFMQTQQLDGSDPNAQLQLNCFGIEYAGFPRKIEARFGDGNLNAVWILTGKGEENRIRKKLIAAYGNPIFKNENWEIFNNWQVGLRKDKPEVLLLTKELGQRYKKEYFKQ